MHPNDHVNMNQSSNDTLLTVMKIAEVFDPSSVAAWFEENALVTSEQGKHSKMQSTVQRHIKIGKTHTQDALLYFLVTPIH